MTDRAPQPSAEVAPEATGAQAHPALDPARLAVFVSGTGRHLQNLCRLSAAGELTAQVAVCISNKPGVGALQHAKDASVPSEVMVPLEGETTEAYGRRAFGAVRAHGAGTVVLAGFLKHLWIPKDFRGRVLNIHPSLLPAFGGKGFYGSRVHRAVLERGCQVTGCTVHLVDEVYDNGPILLQRWCAVEPTDTIEDLAKRVFAEELLALPEGIERFLRD